MARFLLYAVCALSLYLLAQAFPNAGVTETQFQMQQPQQSTQAPVAVAGSSALHNVTYFPAERRTVFTLDANLRGRQQWDQGSVTGNSSLYPFTIHWYLDSSGFLLQVVTPPAGKA